MELEWYHFVVGIPAWFAGMWLFDKAYEEFSKS